MEKEAAKTVERRWASLASVSAMARRARASPYLDAALSAMERLY